MRAYERLLKYVTVRTPSDETSTTVPSSACQFDLAQDLIREFINLGLPKARTDEKCYVYAQIPATPGYENCPKIGFIAHLDTVSDFCDKKIVPVVTENYDGRDLPLGGSDGRVLSVSMFPHLKGSQRSYFDHQQRRYHPRCRRQGRSCRDHDHGRTGFD